MNEHESVLVESASTPQTAFIRAADYLGSLAPALKHQRRVGSSLLPRIKVGAGWNSLTYHLVPG